jgi:hypothetical protein
VTIGQTQDTFRSTTTTAGADPYDLSGFAIPWTPVWPTEPNITSPDFNVPADGSFATGVATGGRRVIVAAGYTGAGSTNWGDDIDVVMDNTATITSACDLGAAQRIRWTGGNIALPSNTGFCMQLSGADVLFDNIRMTGGVNGIELGLGGTTFDRVAVINSTLIPDGDATSGWGIHTQLGVGARPFIAKNDLIIANCYFSSGVYQAARLQVIKRLIIVDSVALDSAAATQSSWRFHGDCDQVFCENIIGRGLIKMDEINGSDTGPSVLNATINNWHTYDDLALIFLSGSHANTGTVSDSTCHHIGSSGTVAQSVSPFADGTGNTRVGWNGIDTSIDWTMGGVFSTRTSAADYGADH